VLYDAPGNNTPRMNNTVVHLAAFAFVAAFVVLVEQLALYFVPRYTLLTYHTLVSCQLENKNMNETLFQPTSILNITKYDMIHYFSACYKLVCQLIFNEYINNELKLR